MKRVDLSKYSSESYAPGDLVKRILWYLASMFFFKTSVPWPQALKKALLLAFGAQVGEGVIIKPRANIKYPWFLKVGDHSWIGEEAWIDNLCAVTIGSHVCISQGVYLATGSHDYKKETFDLIMKPVMVEDGVWIGGEAVICPGVTLKSHAVITAGSVVTEDAEAYHIYQGNPAKKKRRRELNG